MPHPNIPSTVAHQLQYLEELYNEVVTRLWFTESWEHWKNDHLVYSIFHS